MSLFMSNPLICLLTGDPRRSEGATGQHTVSRVLSFLALENRIGSPALWLCQEGVRANLCCTLPSITEQITRRGGEGEGDFKRALWLFLLKLNGCKSLSASCLFEAMQAELVWVIPYMNCTVYRQEACLGGLIFQSWCFAFCVSIYGVLH